MQLTAGLGEEAFSTASPGLQVAIKHLAVSLSSMTSRASFSTSTCSYSAPDSSCSVAVSQERVELKRQLGFFSCVSIIVGTIIGSGIFVSPVGIVANVRSVGMSCVMWAACGLYSTLCALCFAELGTSFPQSGGEYLYIMRAFGDLPAFLCLWINFIVINPVGQAASSLIFATYILKPIFPHCPAPETATQVIAALIMTLLTSVNCVNVKWATKVQGVITASKLIALLTIIVVGVINIAEGEVHNFHHSFSGSDYSGGPIAIAFYSGFWAFGGWNYINFLTEEVINPYRNLPLAIVVSMTIITLVYLTTNIAYFSILSPTEMLESSAVAVTFLERTFTPLAYVMPALIAISVAGGINGSVLSMSRLFFVGARYHHLPKFLSMVNINSFTPTPSLISVLVLTLLMQIYGDIFFLIEMMGFGFAIVLTTVLAGQIYLRAQEPNLSRPIKLPIALPLLLFLVSLAILVLTVYRRPWESCICLIFTASGLPFYVLGTLWEKPHTIQAKIDSLTIMLQKLMMAAPEERNIYDGRLPEMTSLS